MATEQGMQDGHGQLGAVEMAAAAPRRAQTLRRGALVMLALALLVQGCREEEQNRPLVHEKGSYQGPVDQPLDQEQLEALHQRAARQQM